MFPEYDLRNWGEIRKIKVHPYKPEILFTSSGSVFSHEPILFRSTDGGSTWSIATHAKLLYFIFDYSDTNKIYGIDNFTFIKKSTDLGETWVTINNNLVYHNKGIRVLKISKNNPKILYCGQGNPGSDEGEQDPWRLSITTNGGESWERIDSTLLEIDPNGTVYDILLDPKEEGRFYVSYTGGLYLTEDNGKHYQKIYSGETGKIWSDNKTPATIYFNSDEGLLRTLDTITVGVERNKKNITEEYFLSQNYPNPFNPSTTIKYSISKITHPLIPSREGKERSDGGVLVTLKVYDVLGNEITTLVNEPKPPGNYEVNFNASSLSSGIYFYELKSGNFREVKKMLLLR